MLVTKKYVFLKYLGETQDITNLIGYSNIKTIYKLNSGNWETWKFDTNPLFNGFAQLIKYDSYFIISKDENPNYTLYENPDIAPVETVTENPQIVLAQCNINIADHADKIYKIYGVSSSGNGWLNWTRGFGLNGINSLNSGESYLIYSDNGLPYSLCPEPTSTPVPTPTPTIDEFVITNVTYSQSSVYGGLQPATEEGMTNGIFNETLQTGTTQDNYFEWVKIDFGELKYVKNIYVGCDINKTLQGGGWGKQYTENTTLQYSVDDQTYTDIAFIPSGTFTSGIQGFPADVFARYVRIRSGVQGGDGFYLAVTEFKATSNSSVQLPTSTPVPTGTSTPVPTPVPTGTSTPVPTPVPTGTSTPVPTETSTPVPTETSTPVPTGTSTPVPTETSTPVPTGTSTPVPTGTSTPVPTGTSTPVPTGTSTPVPTGTSTPVPTGTSTPVPTGTSTPVPTVTSTPVPTGTPAQILQIGSFYGSNQDRLGYSTSISGDGSIVAFSSLFADLNEAKYGEALGYLDRKLSEAHPEAPSNALYLLIVPYDLAPNGISVGDILGVLDSNGDQLKNIKAKMKVELIDPDPIFKNVIYCSLYSGNENDLIMSLQYDEASQNWISNENPDNLFFFNNNVQNCGLVKTYKYESGNWISIGDFSFGLRDAWTGYSLSLNNDGNVIAISGKDTTNDFFSTTRSGIIKIYSYDGNVWTQKGSDIIDLNDIENNQYSNVPRKVSISNDGNSVAISLISGPGYNIEQGSLGKVLVYEYNSISEIWNLSFEDYGEHYSYFGTSVCISGDATKLAVGSYNYNNSSGPRLDDSEFFNNISNGYVRIYSKQNGIWSFRRQIEGPRVGFGKAVSLNEQGSRIAVSSNNDVKVYDLNENQIGRSINFDFISDVSISKDGDYLAILISQKIIVFKYNALFGDWIEIDQTNDSDLGYYESNISISRFGEKLIYGNNYYSISGGTSYEGMCKVFSVPQLDPSITPAPTSTFYPSPTPTANMTKHVGTYTQSSTYSGLQSANSTNMSNEVFTETASTATYKSEFEWVQLDLGEVTHVGVIHVGCDFQNTLGSGNWGKQYAENRDMEFSLNGVDWFVFANTGTFKTGIKHIFVDMITRYIRISVSNDYLALTEFYAKGIPSLKPTPTATSTPIPTSTPTPNPTATSTPIPTLTPTPNPTSTSTPLPTSTLPPTPTPTSNAPSMELYKVGFLDTATNSEQIINISPYVNWSEWKRISSGTNHALAISHDGKLFSWGSNSQGQLGLGLPLNNPVVSTPTQIGNDNWLDVAAGGYHSLAIKEDGTLWSWGYNVYGQLGDGTTVFKNSPVQIGIPEGVVNLSDNWSAYEGIDQEQRPKRIAAGLYHSLAINQDGYLFGWGRNNYGQTGAGALEGAYIDYVKQIGSETWEKVAAGSDHSLAIRNDGKLFGCGYNMQGQVGDGTNGNNRYTLVEIDDTYVSAYGGVWSDISAGQAHSMGIIFEGTKFDENLARKSFGRLFSWGSNQFFQLGRVTTSSSPTPNFINTQGEDSNSFIPSSWRCFETTCTKYGSVALYFVDYQNSLNSRMIAFGKNNYGELAFGYASQYIQNPNYNSSIINIRKISGGKEFLLFLKRP